MTQKALLLTSETFFLGSKDFLLESGIPRIKDFLEENGFFIENFVEEVERQKNQIIQIYLFVSVSL